MNPFREVPQKQANTVPSLPKPLAGQGDAAGKERPILFSGPMVRAILAGTKTQTRRGVRWPDTTEPDDDTWVCDGRPWFRRENRIGAYDEIPLRCPYGVPGDRLWVRETFRQGYGNAEAHYRADEDECAGGPWKPSIFMPRGLSRLTLEITDVRVQRLQEIGEEDAQAEGVTEPKPIMGTRGYVAAFSYLWDSINGKRAPWESNRWVWAITFRRIE